MSFSPLLATARSAAYAAAGIHRSHLGSFGVDAWQAKGPLDFVTHVDREAEASVVAAVRTAFPEHQILAEEAFDGEATHEAEWLWVVDPLDGTTNYLHAYPMYAVSIAVLQRGTPVVGVVLNSASGEEWYAVRGGGAYRNGQAVRVSAIGELRHSLIGTGFPFKVQHLIPAYLEQFAQMLRATAGVRRAGAASLDLCHVASGYLDGFWELSLAPWDIAAGALIIREAGGIITRMDGSDDVVAEGSIVAGNASIHAALLAAFGGREPQGR